MSASVSAHDLIKIYEGRRVLDGVTVTVSPGQRLGVIGENGAGKSTLLRLLAGREAPDGGRVTVPPEVGLLHQELPHPGGATVAQVLEDGLAPFRRGARRLEQLAAWLSQQPGDASALAAYGEALQWASDHDLWDADRRADVVLAGLGLAGVDRGRPVATLSGGQRSRLGLAALLVRRPRVLLLDEPTNHLDDEAAEFLETHLAGLPGAVVLASHDRVFLDRVCTGLLDLDPSPTGGPSFYGGGYSDYLRAKAAQRRRWQERYDEQQRQLAQLRQAVSTTARQVAHDRPRRDRDTMAYDRHGGRVEAQVSRRVRNARRRLEELARDQVPAPPPPLRLREPLTGEDPAGGMAAVLRGVHVPGRLSLSRLELPTGGRLLVTGGNGAGKSTLLAVLDGRLRPAAGTVTRRRGLRTGMLEQDVQFRDPARTAGQVYAGAAPAYAPGLAELGLLAPREVHQPVGALSVGQRRRLALALLVAAGAQLLLLDEPTNHISLGLAEELEQALRRPPGTVVVATHDRWLRRGWDGPVLTLPEPG